MHVVHAKQNASSPKSVSDGLAVLGCFFEVTKINSLAPGGFDDSLKLVNFKLILTINILSIFCEIAIRWIPQHLTDH